LRFICRSFAGRCAKLDRHGEAFSESTTPQKTRASCRSACGGCKQERQIDEGDAILKRQFRGEQDLKDARHRHNEWVDFIKQLLNRLFSNDEMASEFNYALHGRTIIEEFEHHAAVGFAVVLLTPDERRRAKG
jgi:hypothetical protein